MAGSLHEQMELFAVGGLRDQGGTVDPVSGNKVPIGSTQKEVRDDIPAQLSHGEFVFPADVTRYYGLDALMDMRNKAKQGLQQMENMGQMGGTPMNTGGMVNLPNNPTVQLPQSPTALVKPATVPSPKATARGTTTTTPSGISAGTGSGLTTQRSQFAPTTGTTTNRFSGRTNTATTRAPVVDYSNIQKQNQAQPSFNQLIGTGFAQQQRYSVTEYVNPETGETMYIPHVSGKPIYPPPTGFIEKGQVEQAQQAAATPTDVRTPTARVEEENPTGGDFDDDPGGPIGDFSIGGIDTSATDPYGGHGSPGIGGALGPDSPLAQTLDNFISGQIEDVKDAVTDPFGKGRGTVVGTIASTVASKVFGIAFAPAFIIGQLFSFLFGPSKEEKEKEEKEERQKMVDYYAQKEAERKMDVALAAGKGFDFDGTYDDDDSGDTGPGGMGGSSTLGTDQGFEPDTVVDDMDPSHGTRSDDPDPSDAVDDGPTTDADSPHGGGPGSGTTGTSAADAAASQGSNPDDDGDQGDGGGDDGGASDGGDTSSSDDGGADGEDGGW
tara:strand:- start:10078 stop:11733 length:1656 start_codon:yes stop_codon:yes gene_type:complete